MRMRPNCVFEPHDNKRLVTTRTIELVAAWSFGACRISVVAIVTEMTIIGLTLAMKW